MEDLYRNRLGRMIDLGHSLVALGDQLPWSQIEAALAPSFARKERADPGFPLA